jgi:hypothetical protein
MSGLPAWTRGALPKMPDVVVASGAAGVGNDPSAVGVVYFVVSRANTNNPPLTVVDWHIEELNDRTLSCFVPQVFERLEELGHETGSLTYTGNPEYAISPSLMMEPTGAGELITEQSCDRYMVDLARNKKLLEMDIPQRVVLSGTYISTGRVKISDAAYEKRVAYHGSLLNHLKHQLEEFGFGKAPDEAGALLVAFANMTIEIFDHYSMKGRVRRLEVMG